MANTFNQTMPYVTVAVGMVALVTLVNSVESEPPRARIRHVAVVQPTRIEVDNKANQIRFFVGGKQVAGLDALTADN